MQHIFDKLQLLPQIPLDPALMVGARHVNHPSGKYFAALVIEPDCLTALYTRYSNHTGFEAQTLQHLWFPLAFGASVPEALEALDARLSEVVLSSHTILGWLSSVMEVELALCAASNFEQLSTLDFSTLRHPE